MSVYIPTDLPPLPAEEAQWLLKEIDDLKADNKALTNALQRIEAGEGNAVEIARTTLNGPTRKHLYG